MEDREGWGWGWAGRVGGHPWVEMLGSAPHSLSGLGPVTEPLGDNTRTHPKLS